MGAWRSVERRQFIKTGITAVGGVFIASAAQVPLFPGIASEKDKKISDLQGQVGKANQTATALQSQADQTSGFLTLDSNEQAVVEAIAEVMIPSDANGPGAAEAGVVYFVDRQLASEYGMNAEMYMQGPFVQPGQKGPITVGNVTYPGGSAQVSLNAGGAYQYPFNLREYWKRGLSFLDDYAKISYGASFASLDSNGKTKVLQDLWNNKPTNFTGPLPREFFNEVYNLVWGGFLSDPIYGGNRNMVGWQLTGFSGLNDGNFYGEGSSRTKLMLQTTPTRLEPVSLAQFQKRATGGT
jgi:gluconate 2-dehydrogenase gamma chain